MLENNSPIYAAINNIVNLFELNDKACIFSYKNEKDFEYLWELLDANSTRSGELSKTFIIIWDGIPAREGQNDFVGTSKYLTPMDWAVGFSLSVFSSVNKGIISSPDSRIFIFDLSSHLYPDADSLKIVEQFPKRTMKNLPWVRIFSPGDCAKTFNVDNFIKSIVGNKEDKENLVPSIRDCTEGKPDLDILKNIWASILTRPSSPGDHHAIANLVGPLLLMGENIGEDQHSKAFRSLMTALGLIPKEAKREDFPWIKWDAEPWKDRLSRLTKPEGRLNLILIDDQYQQGWGKVLCQAVGAEYDQDKVPIWKNEARRLTVKAFDSANSLVKRLKELDANNLDQRFRFRIDESDKDEKISEILFLDLRLFSGRSFDDEIKFFEDLIGIGREILKKEKEGKVLPWPSFDEEKEFKRVEKWFGKEGKKREDDEYIVALTFLPRIISLTDLSLPIVIFSSTGRRDIAKKLKDYGNIITDFDKPKFTVDMPEDIAEQTKRKFQEALEKGVMILQGRQICKKVKQLGDIAKVSTPHLVPDGTIIPRFKHIEIYIDETGRSGQKLFTLGGVVIAYPEYEDVFKLDKDLRQQGIYWYSSDSADTKHLSKRPHTQNKTFQGGCANIAWNYNDITETLLSSSEQMGCFVTGVCINDILDAYNNPHDRHFPLKDLSSDARYVRVLSMLIELILFEMIPAWTNNPVTVSIFPGTRISPVEMDKRQTLAKSEKPLDYFGFSQAPTDFGKPQNYYTISAESVVSYVSHVIDSRHDLPAHISVHHSRGVTLTYGVPSSAGKNSLKWDNIRVQNYFADIVVGNKDLFEKQFALGFDANADEDLYTLVEAQHEVQNDNLPLAIELMSSCEQIKEKMHGHIAKKLASSLNVISGSNYIRICQSSTLGVDDGVSSTESMPGEKREIIIVKNIKLTEGRGIKLFCSNEAGKEIIVSGGQTKKIGANALKLRKGDRLFATVVMENDILYGRDIAVA